MSALGQKQKCAVQQPMSALSQKRTLADLFDHFVGGHKQTGWHGPAESLCGLDVENCQKLGCGLHRKVGRLCATQNAVHIDCRLLELVGPFDPVGHETSCGDKEAVRVDSRQAMLSRKGDDKIAMGVGRAVRLYDQAAFRGVICAAGDGAADIGGVILYWSENRLDLERRCYDLSSTQVEIIIGSGFGIDHETYSS